MNSKFWTCFDCAVYFRGSANQIDDVSSNHMCVRKGTERENINKVIKVLQEITSSLPPPIPPPPPDFIANPLRYRSSNTAVLKQPGQPKEVEIANRRKMPESVILELKTKLK